MLLKVVLNMRSEIFIFNIETEEELNKYSCREENIDEEIFRGKKKRNKSSKHKKKDKKKHKKSSKHKKKHKKKDKKKHKKSSKHKKKDKKSSKPEKSPVAVPPKPKKSPVAVPVTVTVHPKTKKTPDTVPKLIKIEKPNDILVGTKAKSNWFEQYLDFNRQTLSGFGLLNVRQELLDRQELIKYLINNINEDKTEFKLTNFFLNSNNAVNTWKIGFHNKTRDEFINMLDTLYNFSLENEKTFVVYRSEGSLGNLWKEVKKQPYTIEDNQLKPSGGSFYQQINIKRCLEWKEISSMSSTIKDDNLVQKNREVFGNKASVGSKYRLSTPYKLNELRTYRVDNAEQWWYRVKPQDYNLEFATNPTIEENQTETPGISNTIHISPTYIKDLHKKTVIKSNYYNEDRYYKPLTKSIVYSDGRYFQPVEIIELNYTDIVKSGEHYFKPLFVKNYTFDKIEVDTLNFTKDSTQYRPHLPVSFAKNCAGYFQKNVMHYEIQKGVKYLPIMLYDGVFECELLLFDVDVNLKTGNKADPHIVTPVKRLSPSTYKEGLRNIFKPK